MKEKIVYLKTDEITPYSNNPRSNDSAVEMVADSIREFGFRNPIIVDKDRVVIAGHTRLKAAEKLGLAEVPVIVAEDLTEDQARAFRLVDNRTAEVADWDFEKLAEELQAVDLDLSAFDFDFPEIAEKDEQSEYEARKAEFEERMAAGELSEDDEEYQEFVRKFEAKHTTDDCYTPALVYDAVADYVEKHYGLKKSDFVRPFYPNGDYQREKYKKTDVVVDNPPFSILSEILTFYKEHGVKFFLFAPNLTIFSAASSKASFLCTGATITYENGANVATSFVTNLETCAFRSAPELFEAVTAANWKNLKQNKKSLPKYTYPKNVILAPMLASLSHFGVLFSVERDECFFLRQLDAQKEKGKALFGSGYLISDAKKADRERAEREKAQNETKVRERDGVQNETWELSEREKEIIKSLK